MTQALNATSKGEIRNKSSKISLCYFLQVNALTQALKKSALTLTYCSCISFFHQTQLQLFLFSPSTSTA